MNEESMVTQIANLGIGENFGKTVFLPSEIATPEKIKEHRGAMLRALTPAILRAKKRSSNEYRTHTTVGFTTTYDVVIAAVVIRNTDEEI